MRMCWASYLVKPKVPAAEEDTVSRVSTGGGGGGGTVAVMVGEGLIALIQRSIKVHTH